MHASCEGTKVVHVAGIPPKRSGNDLVLVYTWLTIHKHLVKFELHTFLTCIFLGTKSSLYFTEHLW